MLPVAPEVPVAPFGFPDTASDPNPLAEPEEIPPPVTLTPFFKSSIRGSYQNSHESYVVCPFGWLIESPLFAGPTPTITPPELSPNIPPVLPAAPEVPVVPVLPLVPVVKLAPLNPLASGEVAPIVDVELVPAVPLVPPDCIPAADPKPAVSPANSCPKNTWIFVFCSPW